MSERPVLGLVCCAAGGLECVRTGLVEPLIATGWSVAVTATPAAAAWLEADSQTADLAQVTGFPVRSAPRLPSETSPHPPVDCYAVVPATANTVAKLALGIADNQALTTVCEAIGSGQVPVMVFPRVNSAHAGHPAWNGHVRTLRDSGVHLIYGEDIWPLHKPGSAPGRQLPWTAILRSIEAVRPIVPGPLRPA